MSQYQKAILKNFGVPGYDVLHFNMSDTLRHFKQKTLQSDKSWICVFMVIFRNFYFWSGWHILRQGVLYNIRGVDTDF